MTDPDSRSRRARRRLCQAALCLAAGAAGAQVQMRGAESPAQVLVRGAEYSGDYIIAVVNSDLVTAAELEQRIDRLRAASARGGVPPPVTDPLRQQALESLIEERVITTYARETGMKVEDADIDRAVETVAAANKLSVAQLRERLRAEGYDYARFRSTLRDQMLAERVREREVVQRIRVQETDVDAYLAQRQLTSAAGAELNIAQILVTVPESAGAEVVAQRQRRAEEALARVRAGEDFAAVAQALSEDGNRARGGEIGLRAASRLPDLFVEQVRDLRPGEVSPTVLRTGAGFHVLKLLERREMSGISVTQTRPRHILLRPSAQMSNDVARQRLLDLRAQIERGSATFEALARQYSEDGSAAQGGDLGWVTPGSLVPEFEEAMNALAIGGVSQPVLSRFGVHLIQVVDRRAATLDAKQVREQARNALREQKFEETYLEWLKELRARAYVEMREPP
jgi:peptidyl-prolyl cis-trans isomerase SurA